MRPKNHPRVDENRLDDLYYYLLNTPRTARDIMSRYDIRRRTVYRDLQRLASEGNIVLRTLTRPAGYWIVGQD